MMQVKKIFRMMLMFALVSGLMAAGASGVFADQITIDLPPVNVTVTKDAEGYAQFSGEGIQYLSQPGEPAIPYMVVKALLPPGADLSTLEVSVERADVISDAVQSSEAWEVRPMPVPQVISEDWPNLNANGEDESVYNTSIRFPYSIVGSISTGALWEWQLADIPIALYHWNPVTKGLFTLQSSQAVLTFEHKSIYSRRSTQTFSGMGKDRVKNLAVNFDQVVAEYPTAPHRRSSALEKSSYVIITTNAIRSASAELDNFVQHKENRGYAVRVITENIWGGGSGDTAAENIRNWLIANYEAMNIEYVLLIGNPHPSTGDVPMKMLWPRYTATYEPAYKECPSDYYYADLTGNWDMNGNGRSGEYPEDFSPGGVDKNYEVIVGRIPFYGSISDLDSILQKTITYQNETDSEWRKNVLLPMEPVSETDPSFYLGEQIRNDIIVPNGWGFHRIYDNYNKYDNSPIPIPADTETVPCNLTNVTDIWKNSDFGAVIWFTHGGPDSAADIMTAGNTVYLDNLHPGFTFQASCNTSYPETVNNLSYALLKNGAITTVGATRVSWGGGVTDYNGSTSCPGMGYGYAKRIITENMKAGYALYDMKQTLVANSNTRWMNFTDFCLYGDPEVAMMESSITDTPPTITDIPDQTAQRDIAVTVPFTVSDDLTPAADLELSALSSNPAIVPAENIIFGGSGEERTLTVTPLQGQTGTVTISVTVRDSGGHINSDSFLLSIAELAEWQWMNPLPQGNTIRDVWAYSENSVFTVGEHGTIMHYDGMNWEVMQSGTSYILEGVWGFSPDDVYAAGWGGTILHYNGAEWTEMNSGTYQYLYDIWGNGPNDIYAVGSYGSIFHFDGTKWSEKSSGTSEWLYGIWGASGSDIYAVGGKSGTYTKYGNILHSDGNTWSELNLDIPQMLRKVWGSGGNNIFAAGLEGIIYHFDGNTWQAMNTGTTQWFCDIWGTGPDNVYALSLLDGIYHFNGSVWAKMWDGQDLKQIAIHGSNAGNIFAVGEGNTVVRYNGSQWEVIMPKGSSADLLDVWGFSHDNIYAVGRDSTVMHYNGNTWNRIEELSTFGFHFESVWGDSPNNIFAASSTGAIYHYNGSNWSISLANTSIWFQSIRGTSSTDVYAAGWGVFDNEIKSKIYHFDGTAWSEIYTVPDYSLEGIWGNSGTGMYFIGAYGSNGSVIIRYNNNTWTETEIGDTNLSGIWGFSGNSIYAVGDRSTVLHFDGNSWAKMDIEASIFEGIWGSSEDNLFAVGMAGYNGDGTQKSAIFHYDGNIWTELHVDSINTINAVWGSAADNVIAVGEFGTILHYTPPAETPVLSVDKELQTVSSASGSAVFNISNAGTGTFTWTAEENSSWFSVSPSSGSVPGVLSINYQSNSGEERSGKITLIADGAANSPKEITITQAAKAARHFVTDWSGNPYNSMNIYVGRALLDGMELSAGDEIAVFDGDRIVGASIVSGDISTENYLRIVCSQDDGSGKGFRIGNAITFRIWDADRSVEKTDITVNFKGAEYGEDIAPPVFTPKEEYGVFLETGSQQQQVSLTANWNIISIPLIPQETDMMQIVQPLIDNGTLIKVIDEEGNRIMRIFGNWVNEIGAYDPSEGYQVKVTSDAHLSINGISTLSQSNLYASDQFDINLQTGWSIMAYPFTSPQDAMNAVQPLIDNGSLLKMIDEKGNRIMKIFGNWVNEIGSFQPGKGYQVKVASDVWISIEEPGTSGRSVTEPAPRSTETVHFTPAWTGKPYNSMMIRIFGLEGYGTAPGDEIGIFDGDICVGAGLIEEDISVTARLEIICSMNDGEGNGFTPGNSISFRFWDADLNTEITDIFSAFYDISGAEPVLLTAPAFETGADYGTALSSGTSSLADAINVLKIVTGIEVYPVRPDLDKSGNGKTGVEDAVYLLQEAAGLR